jgi:glycosyltransferase involved in cell wall biosynthesis
MTLNSQFRGRIFQVIEALDYGDAVSNQAVAIEGLLNELSIPTRIHSKWHHANVAGRRSDLEELQPGEDDIVLAHYAGYSEYAIPYVQQLRCTRICIYHNITPHSFCEPGSALHEFCVKGRNQLPDVVRDFHFFWADSHFNLQELIDLGANPARCAVLPIVVNGAAAVQSTAREPGAWLFLGRIAANKGQAGLVELFARMRKRAPELAQRLYLVGNFNTGDAYYKSVLRAIESHDLAGHVVVTGKVADADVPDYFQRSSVYVSMSEHEGFGVPLVEAAHHGLPVAALRNTAVGETLGDSDGLADDPEQLFATVGRLLGDAHSRDRTLAAQVKNAARFSRDSVKIRLVEGLSCVLPRSAQFHRVSVVICTYDRADLLDRALDYLQYQTCQHFEVVVIDGPSTDHTAQVIAKYRHRIKIGRNGTRNLAISRNLGIELSSGELIAFIDDDAIPFDDWIETILREFNARPLTHAAIGGPAYFAGQLRFQAEDIGINGVAEVKAIVDPSETSKNGWHRSMLGTNTCFRADIIREVGGFDQEFDYFLDESEISFRLQELNYIVGYAPHLYLRHEFAKSANREGGYRFNWYSICKNTAYFIAAYSGLHGAELTGYIEGRMQSERITPLQNALIDGKLDEDQYQAAVQSIKSGAATGLADAARYPQTRRLAPAPGTFSEYTELPDYPVAGRDIPQLHVCLVTREFPPFVPGGGVGTLYYHLASELLLMGHRVTVVTMAEERSVYRCGRFALHYEPLASVCTDAVGATAFTRNANWGFAALHAAAAVAAADPVDIVDSALWDSEALLISLLPKGQRPPLLVRLVTPFPVAARINGWSLQVAEASLLKAAELALINQADAVLAISESIAATIETEYGLRRDSRWRVSHCGIAYWPSFDFSRGYAELTEIEGLSGALPADARLVLFVGRLERRKGVDLVLDAAAQFLGADPAAHLALVGKDIEDMGAQCKKTLPAALLKRIHFLGPLDDASRDKLMHAAYCLLFPSRYESFGLVPLEAFIHGVPVIASRSGAIPEVVIDGDCGLLFEAGNSAMLGDCVARLLRDPVLRTTLSEGATRRARKFGSRNSAIDTVRIYAELLRENP